MDDTIAAEVAEDTILSLLIDDGVRSRGHRYALLNDAFGVCGIFTGPHLRYKIMCVIDYAGDYVKKEISEKVQRQLDYFEEEGVYFSNMPKNVRKFEDEISVYV